jgi:hypothetical protein
MRNKPNSVRPGLWGTRMCETNPIPGDDRRVQARGTRPWGQSYKQTQFGAARRRTRVQNAKQTQSGAASWKAGPPGGEECETNPICRRQGTRSEGQGPEGQSYKQSQFAPETPRRPSPRACPERRERAGGLDAATRHGGHDAKQSQFRRRVERANCLAGKELWWFGHACETKPISPGLHPRRGPIVRNKPNSGRRRVGRCRGGVGYGAIVQTKPFGGARRQAAGDQLRQTRRARQKSANADSSRVSGPIPRIGSADPDFCRRRQTKPIGRRARCRIRRGSPEPWFFSRNVLGQMPIGFRSISPAAVRRKKNRSGHSG